MKLKNKIPILNLNSIIPLEIKPAILGSNPKWLDSVIETNLQFNRFNVGTRNSTKLNLSLNLFANNKLRNNTLLSRDVSGKQAGKLNVRFQRKIYGIIKKERSRIKKYGCSVPSKAGSFAVDEHSIVNRRVRFMTIIHALVGLNVEDALKAAKELKNEIISSIKQVAGATCLGALEVEVVSIRNMRRLRQLNSNNENIQYASFDEVINTELVKRIQIQDDSCDDEKLKDFRKLNVCEGLGQDLGELVLGGESGCLLVHFHGLVTVTKESQIDEVLQILNKNPKWKIKQRQIRFQKLQKFRRGEVKPIKLSLEHLARYFTKGGNDFQDGKSYLQYKVKLPKGISLTYDEQLTEWDKEDNSEEEINFDRNLIENKSDLDVDLKKSTTNFLSLSVKENNVLANVISAMMNWNTTGTGYLVTVGRWYLLVNPVQSIEYS